MNCSKKSQVSVFLIIGTIAIVSIGFLVSMDVDEKEKVIQQEQDEKQSKSSGKTIGPVKDTIDYCLQRQLQRGLIIAGMKGGYIYEHDGGNERYMAGASHGIYGNSFINELGLNWNNLLYNTLIYYDTKMHVPRTDSSLELGSKVIYPKPIKDDFEKFIKENFMDCVNFNRLEREGYEITRRRYSSPVEKLSEGKLHTSKKLVGEEGDNVSLYVGGKSFSGEINKVGENKTVIDMHESVSSTSSLSNWRVYNENSSINVNVDFDNEKVNAQIFLPVTIKSGEYKTSFSQSSVSANIRFKKLLGFAKKILREKVYNKSLDLTKNSNIESILEDSYYLANTNKNNIEFRRTEIKDDDDHKKYVYTLIDNDSKVLGKPYVFNFGYENTAPFMNISEVASFMDGKPYILTSVGSEYNMDLSSITSDVQFIDNLGNFSYFLPRSYSAADARFQVDTGGNVEFKPFVEREFTFEVGATDRETVRKEEIVFLTSIPDNTDNKQAANCFNLESTNERNEFPILPRYKNIYTYTTGGGKEMPYVYGLNNGDDIELSFSRSCFLDTSKFCPKLYIDGNSQRVLSNSNTISVSPGSSTRDIKVELYQKSGGSCGSSPVTEPFEMKVLSSECLGPGEDENITSLSYVDNGDLSCCDMDLIQNNINESTGPPSNNIDPLEGSGSYAVDATLKFCLNPYPTTENVLAYQQGYFNFHNNSIWDSSYNFGGLDISVYKGRFKAECDGNKPLLKDNFDGIESTGGTDMRARSTGEGGFKLLGARQKESLTQGLSLEFTEVNDLSQCKFCALGKYGSIGIEKDGKKFFMSMGNSSQSASVSDINDPDSPHPDSGITDTVAVMCEDKWYACNGGSCGEDPVSSSAWDNSDWSEFIGKDSYRSKGFCGSGGKCRVSPDYDINIPSNANDAVTEEGGVCKQVKFTGSDFDIHYNDSDTRCAESPITTRNSSMCEDDESATCYYNTTCNQPGQKTEICDGNRVFHHCECP